MRHGLDRRSFLAGGVVLLTGCARGAASSRPTVPADERLSVRAAADHPLDVRFRLTAVVDDEVVVDETRTLDPGETASLADAFDDEEYRLTLFVDGSEQFTIRIHTYDSYVLAVHGSHDVEIVSHTET